MPDYNVYNVQNKLVASVIFDEFDIKCKYPTKIRSVRDGRVGKIEMYTNGSLFGGLSYTVQDENAVLGVVSVYMTNDARNWFSDGIYEETRHKPMGGRQILI